MSRYGLVSLILFLAALTVFFVREVPSMGAQVLPYQPLEGTLFKGRIEALEKADTPLPSIPKNASVINVFVRDPQMFGLNANATEFLGKVVSEGDAKAEIGPIVKRPARFKNRKPEAAVHASEPSPASPPAQKSVPERMMTFNNLDAALNGSDASFPLKNRFQKGGITFQLTLIGKWNGFYLLKYSLTNEETREFFIASVQLATGGDLVPAESFVPFSCLPQTSIMGIVKFPIDGMTNKVLSIVLEKNGGKYLKLEIKDVDFKF
jgi:hypothetical protein